MNTGILGGTFDPVHLGHLILAEQARAHLGLDRVLFVPAGQPWRKSHRAITPAAHRLAMLRLAIGDGAVEDRDDGVSDGAGDADRRGDSRDARDGAFEISEIELRRPGPTYTADTLAQLAAEHPDDAFYFIIGADSLADLPNWHEPQRILREATLAVAPRGDDVAVDIDATAQALRVPAADLKSSIAELPMPRIEITSTDIRARVREGRSIRYLVPAAVEAYIAEHRLYEGERAR